MFPNRIALTAASVTAIPVGISFIKSMPVFAVSRRNPLVGMARSLKWAITHPCSASKILFVGYCFDMFPNIDTVGVSATPSFDVIKFQSCWNDANLLGVQPPVGQLVSAVEPEQPITSRGYWTQVQHAAVCSARINLRPKALFGGKLYSHLDLLCRGVMQRGASYAAAAFSCSAYSASQTGLGEPYSQ